MWLTRTVFRCFKCVERTAERVTGAVGPLFIGIAVILIGIGIFSFCKPHSCKLAVLELIPPKLVDIIAPTLRWRFITTPICAVIALNTVANYYWAITVPPGFADQDIRLSGHRRSTPIGHWERWTTAPMHTPPRGSEFMRSHELEPGKVGKCQKCGSIKPEVSSIG
jgi:palmitoyltransferase